MNIFLEYNKNPTIEERNRIFNLYYLLLVKVCKKFVSKSNTKFSLDEIISLGSIGLLKAIEKNNLARKNFESFAVVKIKNSIIDELRKEYARPRENFKKIVRVLEDDGKTLEEKFSLSVIQERTGLSTKQIKTEIKIVNGNYINFKCIEPENFISSSKDGFTQLVELETLRELADAFNSLDCEAREFLTLYFFKNFTCLKIGKVFGYSENVASRKLKKFLRDLKDRLNGIF